MESKKPSQAKTSIAVLDVLEEMSVDGECTVPFHRIADAIGKNHDYIRKVLGGLIAQGVVAVTPAGGKNKPNLYRIALDIAAAYRIRMENELPDEFWTPERTEILRTMRAEGVSLMIIATHLGTTPGTVAGKSTRMVAKGEIEKRPSPIKTISANHNHKPKPYRARNRSRIRPDGSPPVEPFMSAQPLAHVPLPPLTSDLVLEPEVMVLPEPVIAQEPAAAVQDLSGGSAADERWTGGGWDDYEQASLAGGPLAEGDDGADDDGTPRKTVTMRGRKQCEAVIDPGQYGYGIRYCPGEKTRNKVYCAPCCMMFYTRARAPQPPKGISYALPATGFKPYQAGGWT